MNAFAVPGGYIYVNRGLIERAQNMAQVAGVLGHEIGHVVERHSIEQMQKAQRAQTGPVQAVPNTVQTPNRPDGTRPPAKATGSTDIPGLQMGGEQKQPQPSGGQR